MEVVPTVMSELAPAAVGFDGGAGDIRRVWGEQKRDHGGDFGRLIRPPSVIAATAA